MYDQRLLLKDTLMTVTISLELPARGCFDFEHILMTVPISLLLPARVYFDFVLSLQIHSVRNLLPEFLEAFQAWQPHLEMEFYDRDCQQIFANFQITLHVNFIYQIKVALFTKSK